MLNRPAMEPRAEQTKSIPAAKLDVPARDIFVRRITVAVVLVVVSGLLLTLFILGIEIILAAFGGLLVAVFLRALMSLVQRVVPLPDGWALAVVLVLILAVLGVGGWLLAPQLMEQSGKMGEEFRQVATDVEEFLRQRRWGVWLLERTQIQGGGLPQGVRKAVGDFFTMLSDWFTYILTALFVGLFLAANAKLYQAGVVHLFPLDKRMKVNETLDEIGTTLRWWLIGQLFTMVIIGVSVTIVLWAFGTPLAIVIGLLVGLLGFIPYLGPWFGLIPVTLVALPGGPMYLLYVLLAYSGVQLLEGYIAMPLIQQRTVYLPPAFTVITQILLGVVLGLLGFVLATPLAAVALVLTRFYRKEILGDPSVDAPDDADKDKQGAEPNDAASDNDDNGDNGDT